MIRRFIYWITGAKKYIDALNDENSKLHERFDELVEARDAAAKVAKKKIEELHHSLCDISNKLAEAEHQVKVKTIQNDLDAAYATERDPIDPTFTDHPGKLLDKILQSNNMTVDDLSQRLRYGKSSLQRIINGHSAITANLALRLERVNLGRARSWMVQQDIWDISVANREHLDISTIT